MKKSHYEVLDVKPQSDPAEIKRAYRRKARKAHPDIGGDEREMAEINRAYDCLSDPARRLVVEQTGVDSTKSFAEDVQSVLLAAFSDALNKETDLCLIHAKRFIEQERANLQKQLEVTQRAEARLKKKRAEISSTKDNVFHLLIDQQLAQITTAVGAITRGIGVLDGAVRELENYSSSEKVTRQTMVYSSLTFNDWTST